MDQRMTLTERILDVVQHAPNCSLDVLVEKCPGFTWNQVYLEVDRMSRVGQLQLIHEGFGVYLSVQPREGLGKALETPVVNPELHQSEVPQAS